MSPVGNESSASMIDRVVKILEVFEPGDVDLSLAEISGRAGLAKSSTHRLIQILLRHRLMKSTGNGSYALGIGLWELGTRAIGGQRAQAELSSAAERAAEQFGETSHVAVLDGWEVVYVVRAESQAAVAVRTHIGQRAPAHATSTGKALLAAVMDERKDFDDQVFSACTDRTITNVEDLKRELREVKARGYATNFGAWQPDLCGAAAVIFGHDDQPVGALGIAGPTFRFSQQSLDEAGLAISHMAAEVSAALGSTGHPVPG